MKYTLRDYRMKICVVASCSSNSIQHTELSWHGLPKDGFQRDQWIDVLGLKDTEVTDQMRVCSLHFKPKDYLANRKSLKYDAVPSVRLSGRGKTFRKDSDDDEYYPSDTASDDSNNSLAIAQQHFIQDVKPPTKRLASVKMETTKKEDEGELERQRPSRRAARLAAEKILNTVRKYNLSSPSQKKEDKLRSTPAIIPYPDIDLLMECHEELLTSAQAEALLKAQLEYNMVLKMLRTLKASNARIIHVYSDSPEDSETVTNSNTNRTIMTSSDDVSRPVILHSSSDATVSSSQSSATFYSPVVSQSKPSITVTPQRPSSAVSTRPTTVVLTPKSTNVAASTRPSQTTVQLRPTSSSHSQPVMPLQSSPILLGQTQPAIQLLRAVPQQQAILITTNPTSGAVVSTSPSTLSTQSSSTASSLSYKVLVDSRTGIVVGTLPSDTTILQSPDPTSTLAETSSTVQGSAETTKLVQESVESSTDQVRPHQSQELLKSKYSVISTKQTEEKSLNTSSQDKSIILITGGFKMVTAQTLLSVKPCPLQKQDCSKESLDKLNQQLEEEKFAEEPVKWLIKMKLLADQPVCRWCIVGSSELVSDNVPMDGYSWLCCNPQCRKSTPVTRLNFFARFGIPLSKLLPLTYHWAMQSDVEKVLKNIDVDIYMVRSVWRALQEVCARTLSLKAKKLGSDKSTVEVAIAQIGRFFILGALDRKSSLTRLKAISISIGWNFSIFHKGFEPWLTDNALVISNDPKLEDLNKTGFQYVMADENIKDKTSAELHVLNITEYLKTQLTNMFGKFWVNQLKLETVQGFLDELQWRERYGISPVDAFWSILSDIAEQSGRKAVSLRTESEKEDTNEETLLSSPSPSSSSSSDTEVTVEIHDGEYLKDKKKDEKKRLVSEETALSLTPKRKKKTEADISVSLDEYYYARMEPDPEKTIKDEKKNYQYKCHLCKKILDSNIKVMKHINSHIENSRQHNLDLSDLTQCKYCFRDFETPFSMQCHIEAVHLKTNSLACHICNQAFSSVSTLTHHMKIHHFQSEMPYSCQVCLYRSSFHREVLEHFHQVHSGSDKVLCHYCLKVYNIKFSTVGLGFIQNYYNHMYKHQLKSSTRKCPTCCLVFLNHYELKNHKTIDHLSMKDKPGVVPMKCDNQETLIVINPNEKPIGKPRSKPAPVSNIASTSSLKVPPLKLSKLSDFSTLEKKYATVTDNIENHMCIECKSNIDAQHFRKYVSCGQCLYATNCTKAFVDHMICLHSDLSKKRPTLTNLKPLVMKTNMHCVCGFTSYKGNSLASHLVQCGKNTCYSSLERVLQENVKTIKSEPNDPMESQSAFFPPLVVLDENEEASINDSFAKVSSGVVTEDTKDMLDSLDSTDEEVEVDNESTVEERPDMLNALGLVRKKSSSLAPSTPSTQDENSNASQDNIQAEQQPMDIDPNAEDSN